MRVIVTKKAKMAPEQVGKCGGMGKSGAKKTAAKKMKGKRSSRKRG